MTEAKTVSPLESAVHSIAWMDQLGGEPSPTDHPLVLVGSIVLGNLSTKRFWGDGDV